MPSVTGLERSHSSGRSCAVWVFPQPIPKRSRKPSRTNGYRLEIRPLPFIGLGKGQYVRVGCDAPRGAGLQIERGPPVLMPGQPLLPHRRPVAQDLRPALVAIIHGLFTIADLRDVPLASQ